MGTSPSSTPTTPSVRSAIPSPRVRVVKQIIEIEVKNGILKCIDDKTIDLQDASDIGKKISLGEVAELFLINCTITNQIFKNITSSLSDNICEKLVTVQLTGCVGLTDYSVVPFLNWILVKANNIRVLSLSRTAIGNNTLDVLANHIKYNITSLVRIWLCGLSRITNTALVNLITSAAYSPEIEIICSGCLNVANCVSDELSSADYLSKKKKLILLKSLTYRKWQSWALATAGYRNLNKKNYRESRSCFLKSTQVSPESPYAAFGMATLCHVYGKRRQASLWSSIATSLSVKRVQRKFDKYEQSDSPLGISTSRRHRRIRWVVDLPIQPEVGSCLLVLVASMLVIISNVTAIPFNVISKSAVQTAREITKRGRYENNCSMDDSH